MKICRGPGGFSPRAPDRTLVFYVTEKMDKSIEKKWTEKAREKLLGRKIVKVRYMTDEEREMMGWYRRTVVLHLDNGDLVFAASDDEQNSAGSLSLNDGTVLPVL